METATEIRNELLQMGRDLIAEMRKITGPINEIVCRLEAESDRYLKDSVDEKLQSRGRRKIVYRERPATEGAQDTNEKPRKRACSKCRQPGHRATSCPN